MKTCTGCRRRLPAAQFYAYARSADGLFTRCKPCERARVRADREARRDHYNAYDRERRRNDPKRRAQAKAYLKRAANKVAARKAVANALLSGRLVRKPCKVCGAFGEAHHVDYTKPLKVVWLCRVHHMRLHGEQWAA